MSDALVAAGHNVTLFASGDSVTAASLAAACPQALRLDPTVRDQLALLIAMLETVAERAREFDVIDLHCDYLGYSALRRTGTPFLATLHGRLDLPELKPLYSVFCDVPVVSISDAQRAPLPTGALYRHRAARPTRTNNAGTWTLTQADLTGLMFTPAAETDGTVVLSVIATDTETGAGNTASSVPQTITITVNEEADAPTLGVSSTVSGTEGQPIALTITATKAEADHNAPTVTITGLNGGSLNHGTNKAGTWTLTQADLTGLIFTPANDTNVTLSVTATDNRDRCRQQRQLGAADNRRHRQSEAADGDLGRGDGRDRGHTADAGHPGGHRQ
jgi:Glycosyltransferase Family 4